MIIASAAIYLSSSRFRRDDFKSRLRNKAISTATLLFDRDKAEADDFLRIEKNSPVNLQNEKIIILNFKNDTVYSSDHSGDIKVRSSVLERIRSGNKVSYVQDSYEVLGTLYPTKYDRFVIIAAATDIEGTLYLEKLKITLIFVCLVSLVFVFYRGMVLFRQSS